MQHARPRPVRPGPHQESVWDYPRPPRLEAVAQPLRVVFHGSTIADTRAGFRVLETSHPPVYYFPPDDVDRALMKKADGGSFCEWKGVAHYYDVVVGDKAARRSAWAYADPAPAFAAIRDHIAFYAQFMDACFVGDERAWPQPGEFYGGWVTSKIVGPFKGEPGSAGW